MPLISRCARNFTIYLPIVRRMILNVSKRDRIGMGDPGLCREDGPATGDG